MSRQAIPKREPIQDIIEGVVTRLGNDCLLSTAMLTSGELVAAGELAVRYGIPYLGRHFHSLVPDLVVVDYGEMLVAEAAWEFLVHHSHLYPRADVLGYRDDGSDEMLVVKQLDFAIPFDVLVYRQASDRKPFASLRALIASNRAAFPQRLLNYLPAFDSLADWQTRHE